MRHNFFFSLPERNNLNGSIPVECFENTNMTYFDVGKDLYVLIHTYFCLHKTKVMKCVDFIGTNNLTGSIYPKIENMKNVKVLFLGKKFLFETLNILYFLVLYSQILVHLEIDSNQLDGSIPSAIGTLNSLEKLNLGEFRTECGDFENNKIIIET